MKFNQAAFEKAQSLVEAGKVNLESDWSEAQPSPEDENKFLENADWEKYSEWHLGIDPEENEDTKAHYGFPYGDFDVVHRSGLIAAQQRAGQYDYDDIKEAVNDLLVQIDSKPDAVSAASEDSFPASDPPNWRDSR